MILMPTRANYAPRIRGDRLGENSRGARVADVDSADTRGQVTSKIVGIAEE